MCLHAFRRGEEPARRGGTEAAAAEIAEVVTDEGAPGRAGDEQRDPRVSTPRGRDPEGADHGLTRQHREDRVESRDGKGDPVTEQRADLEAAERAHGRPAALLTVSVAPVSVPAVSV